jgi:Uma2 family endonuclease
MAEASLLDHPWITRWKLDVHAYHRLGEAGILGADDRVELIEGEVVAMSPIGAAHIGAVMALTRLLVLAVGDRAHVSPQGSIRLQEHSEPQPDIALLRPRADQYRSELPTPADILLLVEVADSSLRFDRLVKLPLYARHGIPVVWIVDLLAGVVEVHAGPRADGYASTTRAGRGETIEPLPGLVLRVDDILG